MQEAGGLHVEVIGMIDWISSLNCILAILFCGLFEAFIIEAIYRVWKSEC